METIVIVIVLWHVFGAIALMMLTTYDSGTGAVSYADGIEFVNPAHIYYYNQVNWFGAFFVATLYGLICPVATVGYWIYKLCTVGRK